ncbi:tetratricopeptide repeat protein [Undibacterium sp.]|jgi:predicted negative regulator of RcsB-dependent stress response|uniref:YfgM family protein n=1 Tax=Undibacterium sp. TaxID=1914977 RepID=UPI002B5BF113|nr:tetratricopeptide repeat protein [Undibacterium sp.]HTD02372.1 tetratricopeptide repeat protein [Undibacterium sp.]
MAYDLEEQEQLDTLKAWWKQYGNLITWLLIICLTAFAGWTYWNNYRSGQAAQASLLYEELQKSVQAKDNAKVQRAAGDLIEKFGKTAYAPMAALSAAKSAFEANDLKVAKAQLQWVIDHDSAEEYKALAKIRLAGVALDEKAYDEGLKLLSGEFAAEFAGDVADRQGDIYAAQNKIAEARAAYQTALEKTNEKNPGRQLIQLKLEAIGGTAAAKVASK